MPVKQCQLHCNKGKQFLLLYAFLYMQNKLNLFTYLLLFLQNEVWTSNNRELWWSIRQCVEVETPNVLYQRQLWSVPHQTWWAAIGLERQDIHSSKVDRQWCISVLAGTSCLTDESKLVRENKDEIPGGNTILETQGTSLSYQSIAIIKIFLL